MNSTTAALVQQNVERAKSLLESHDYTNARRALEAALWKAEQIVGAGPSVLQEPLELLGRCCYEMSQYPQAVGHLSRLLGLQHSSRVETDKILQTLDLLVRCYEIQGRLPLAEQTLKDAVQLCVATWGEGGEKTVSKKKRLANVLMELRKADEAEAVLSSIKSVTGEVRKPGGPPPLAPLKKPTGTFAQPLVPERKAYLGQMLRSAGLISYAVLSKNLELAKTIGIPLGEALIAGGFVERAAIIAALEVQSMIRADQIEMDDGIKLLMRCCQEKITVAEAMSGAADKQKEASERYRLGRLLVVSGHLTETQLSDALRTSREADVPLGKHLVLSGRVPPLIVAKALEMQTMLFEGAISEQAALAALAKGDADPAVRSTKITNY
ncbi:MAG: hypothetical protein K2W95_32595 [Candidatus Obscuribacterales bacterium]|nr:hypothetical protein [Candidatus Obscuribacterales bacterium]